MARPSTEAEYLARMVPSSSAGMSRRPLLRGALGAGALLAAPPLLASCSSAVRPEAAAGRPAPATGTVTLGSNQSDAVPKAAVAVGHGRLPEGQQRPDREDQHDRPQHVPGEHQQLPAGRSRTTCSRGSPATGCGSSPPRTWPATSRDVWGNLTGMSDALQEGVHRRRRQAVLRPVDLLPVGDLLPEVRLVAEKGYTAAEDARRAEDPRRKDAAGRARPDRLRATRTAGRRWARSTSSTCGSTATTSTSA